MKLQALFSILSILENKNNKNEIDILQKRSTAFSKMTENLDILSFLNSFLNELQSFGIIKEYNLNYEKIDEKNIQTFESLFKKFVEGVNSALIAEKQSTENAAENSVEMNQAPAIEEENNIEKGQVTVINEEHNTEKIEVSVVDEENKGKTTLKMDNVQLQVDENEIKRRINAFVSRKRKEVDEWNVQEFCSRPYIEDQNPVWEQMDSCARVDAVFIPRFGSKSHVKVSKVENRWGPQTQSRSDSFKRIKHESDADREMDHNDPCLEAIHERIKSMEAHLNLNSEQAVRSSIFQRLKQLEDRILYLEGLSPDYFSSVESKSTSPKKKNIYERENIYSNWTIDDIQKRIQSLKESLKAKSQMKIENPG